jgi:glycosyltransferase involved in cell wall biosynthesis/uncharacterized SAM-binding protein YcdF (DUF218 family)
MGEDFRTVAKRAWEYLRINDTLEKADVLFVMGSPSLAVVDKAVELYQAGFAKKIAFISGRGTFSNHAWGMDEYRKYHEEFLKKGIPESALLYGIGTTNTLEEVKAAIPFLREKGMDPRKMILVSIPVHQRRAYATFAKQFPGIQYINCPAEVPFADTPEFFERIVLEVDRLVAYGAKGDMVEQDVPLDIASIATMLKVRGTVTVLTKNSGKTLERALESVRHFDDIVICDGGSTDNTLVIAGAFGARVITQNPAFLENGKIFDYASVRNQTLAASKHNWIFWLDSDEECGVELLRAMRKTIADRGEDGEGAFWVERKYVIDGTVIDCAATYPNRQMRFFAKRSTEGMVKKIHERIKVKEGVKKEILDGIMYIPFEADIAVIRKKWDYQIAVAASQVAPMSIGTFVQAVFHTLKISTLWLYRLVRNMLFCSGTKMPLKFEMERHYFHLRLLRALWGVVKL